MSNAFGEINILCEEELERFIEDLGRGEAIGVQYLDTWDYEDDYSHNDIEEARRVFIKKANEILSDTDFPFFMRDVCENAMLCSSIDKKPLSIL